MENQNQNLWFLSCILPLSLLSCSSPSLTEEVKSHVFQWTVTVCLVRDEFMPLYSISDNSASLRQAWRFRRQNHMFPVEDTKEVRNLHLRVQRDFTGAHENWGGSEWWELMCLWPQREVSALCPSQLFTHCPHNKELQKVFHVLVLSQPSTAPVPALPSKAEWSFSWDLLGIPEFGIRGV